MDEPEPGREVAGTVAIILAAGIVTALNVITITVFVAVWHDRFEVLGENTTQILVGWGGGIISVIAGYVGYVVGKRVGERSTDN